MTIAHNDITGDPLISKTPSDSYRDGWDRIFGIKPHNHEWVDSEPTDQQSDEEVLQEAEDNLEAEENANN